MVIDWTALANSDGSVSATPTFTNSDGESWTNWTIGAGHNELRAAVHNAADTVAVTFVANGSSGTTAINSCPIGGGRDPINDPSKPYAFWVPGPADGVTMREVNLFFGASGKANHPAINQIALVTRRGDGFLGATLDSAVVNVELRGNASENKRTTFRVQNPIVGRRGNASSTANAVAMQLIVLNNPDNATVNFNTGPCPLGNCKVPRECAAFVVIARSVPEVVCVLDHERASLRFQQMEGALWHSGPHRVPHHEQIRAR